MGMLTAVASVYVNMFNFSGRARRAEYWWFTLFWFLVSLIFQAGLLFWAFSDPGWLAAAEDPVAMKALAERLEPLAWRYSAIFFAVTLLVYWVPYLAVTVRRLHDTGRSGWWMFKPLLVAIAATFILVVLAVLAGGGAASPALVLMAATAPTAASIWFIVVLCLPGTHGSNRFGPDPIKDRPPAASGHPVHVKQMDEELVRQVAERRREEFQDYYRARVLPAIERNKSARRT